MPRYGGQAARGHLPRGSRARASGGLDGRRGERVLDVLGGQMAARIEQPRSDGTSMAGDMMPNMGDVVDLLERRVYSFSQIDRVLDLAAGTAARWIDGYTRAGRFYEPVVRPEHTGDEVATWGELVECRLLAEYRGAGVSIQRMRPAVERLRNLTDSRYPLASARLWLGTDGRELVAQVQDAVNLDRALSLVVVRSGQAMIDWTPRASNFAASVTWSTGAIDAEPVSLAPDRNNLGVEIDPRRGYGDPVIRGRSVPTSVIRELVRAGEPIESIAESYSLTTEQIEAALRFELGRAS